MLRTAWWAALSLGLLLSGYEEVRADTLTIPFSALGEYASQSSSRAIILSRRFELVRAERDEALQWSNPKFSFAREDAGPTENQFTIGKAIDPPWVYFRERSSWNTRVRAAENAYEHDSRQLLADLKTRYVNLRLMNDQLGHLGHLEATIVDVSRIVSARRAEGHLSEMDAQLVRMALISLHAIQQATIRSRGEIDAAWRALIGVGPEIPIRLSTAVPVRTVALASAQTYALTIASSPGYQSHQLDAEFSRSQARVARGRFIPRLNLFGGLKDVAPDQSGYVLGVSLGIPLFHRNGAAARSHKLRSEIADQDAEAYRIYATARIQALIAAIEGSQAVLSTISDDHEDAKLTMALFQSYEEGWINLHEFLNAIQVVVNGLTDQYGLLADYYENIFALEALTGETLIEFTTEER